jgi:predicted dehydrogenase
MIWPCVDVIYDLSPADQRQVSGYDQQLTSNLSKVIDSAVADLSPASLFSGHGQVDFAINRRNAIHPDGPVDHDVPVLKVAGPDGRVKAVLFGYACHNTTMVEDNYLINGDYAGFAQLEIEKNNPGATALFLMGCGGDQNPAPRGTLRFASEHGQSLASEVQRVLGGEMHPVRAPIRTSYTRISLAFRPFDLKMYQKDITGTDKYLQRRAKLMLEAYNKGWPVDKLSYPVQAVRFSKDLTMLALGDEIVVDYALFAKKEFAGENLFVAGYCNAVQCYIPSRRVLGEGGYEPDESMIYYGMPGPFADDVEDRIAAAIRAVMKDLGVKGAPARGLRQGGLRGQSQSPGPGQQEQIRLITLDPGHFHAALVQKSGYPGIDTIVHVYAPSGPELKAHLGLIEKYNTRADAPTKWKEQVYEGPDYLQRMFREKAGNVVVIAGNNRRKIGYIRSAVDSGFNVLADKPMIIRAADFESLKEAFATAKRKGVILYDIMTERYQITTLLQRELSMSPEIFGRMEQGSKENPAVTKESVHHFVKYVSGKTLTRPAWYFDVSQEGEGIADVTTHLVDLIQWECFPDTILDYKKDIRVLSARRWPTVLTPSQFEESTQLAQYPAFLAPYVQDSLLKVYANGEMDYTLKGVHARVSVKWDFAAPEGSGDTHFSILRGTKANLVIRQGKEQQYKPVLFIEPVHASTEYDSSLAKAIGRLQAVYPGIGLRKMATGWEVLVPEKYSLDHEATFAEVTKKFLNYVKQKSMPDWEVPAMLAKYYTTVKALEMARASGK